MFVSLKNFMTAAIATVLFAGGTAIASEDPSDDRHLTTFHSNDIMRLSGSERENTIALEQGIRLGNMSTTT